MINNYYRIMACIEIYSEIFRAARDDIISSRFQPKYVRIGEEGWGLVRIEKYSGQNK